MKISTDSSASIPETKLSICSINARIQHQHVGHAKPHLGLCRRGARLPGGVHRQLEGAQVERRPTALNTVAQSIAAQTKKRVQLSTNLSTALLKTLFSMAPSDCCRIKFVKAPDARQCDWLRSRTVYGDIAMAVNAVNLAASIDGRTEEDSAPLQHGAPLTLERHAGRLRSRAAVPPLMQPKPLLAAPELGLAQRICSGSTPRQQLTLCFLDCLSCVCAS